MAVKSPSVADGKYLTQDVYSEFLDLLLTVGQLMLAAGSEVSRIENTMARIAKSYGAVETDIFVITSNMVATIEYRDGTKITRTKRLVDRAETNLSLLDKINALSRTICDDPVPVSEFKAKLDAIARKRSVPFYIAGSVLTVFGFALLFGGAVADAACSGIIALLICLFQQLLMPICPNKLVFNVLCSFLTTLAVCGICALLVPLNFDKILIGDIMLLIPGLAMTNSIRDMFSGETISGIIRLIESLLWAGGLAIGCILAMLITGWRVG